MVVVAVVVVVVVVLIMRSDVGFLFSWSDVFVGARVFLFGVDCLGQIRPSFDLLHCGCRQSKKRNMRDQTQSHTPHESRSVI